MKFSRLILANLFRKKVRLILTIGSFAIALVLFTFLAVLKSAFSLGTEIAGAGRLIVVSRIGLMQLLPISDRDKIMAIPGVKAVTHNHWFGGVYQDEKNFFPQFVIDPERPSGRHCLRPHSRTLPLENRGSHPHQDDSLWRRCFGVQSRQDLSQRSSRWRREPVLAAVEIL